MTMLPWEIARRVSARYFKAFKLRPLFINVNGEIISEARKKRITADRLPVSPQTNAFSLQEAIRWGEPFVFYPVRGVVNWVAALVDQRHVRGGLLGGEVLTAGVNRKEISSHLIAQGLAPALAENITARLKVWPAARIKQAAIFLQETFYRTSGWKPVLLEENRLKALQQRHISEAMDEYKKNGQTGYSVDKERMLLALIRAGDQNGARKVLNEMLGAMYLLSTKLAVLRARAIELMGYLTRAAVEDSPTLEPLIERNHRWMRKLIVAPDFETLSHVLMQALDDFMHGIYARGFNCYHPHVGRILDYVALHYSEDLSLKQVAAGAGISVSRAAHLVKQHTGKTIWQHLMRMRIARARQMLENTNEQCDQIALSVGFCDQSYFTKHFRRLTGTTPVHYRRSLSGVTPEKNQRISVAQAPPAGR
ncbi:MAG: AraC family transcriptional regulator [Kiritimatiellae bacterium]|nr:AraC family transcriptional regulator [Kiritimatiellia bacterium]